MLGIPLKQNQFEVQSVNTESFNEKYFIEMSRVDSLTEIAHFIWSDCCLSQGGSRAFYVDGKIIYFSISSKNEIINSVFIERKFVHGFYCKVDGSRRFIIYDLEKLSGVMSDNIISCQQGKHHIIPVVDCSKIPADIPLAIAKCITQMEP